MVIKLKGCPKCQGDLYLNRDSYGKYLNCLQCGFMKDLVEPPVGQRQKPVAVDSPVAAAPVEYQLAA